MNIQKPLNREEEAAHLGSQNSCPTGVWLRVAVSQTGVLHEAYEVSGFIPQLPCRILGYGVTLETISLCDNHSVHQSTRHAGPVKVFRGTAIKQS